mgnify:CR=1 FL=1
MSKKIKPYKNSESKKNQIKQMFNKIAYRYDFLNRFLTFGIDNTWRKTAVRKIQNKPKKILDIATGTADLAIISAQITSAQITGVDISDKMLKIGNQKITKKNLNDRIKLMNADAENLSYNNDYFDAVTVGFGVRNFENLNKGLKEIYRVLKNGGYVAILEPSHPKIFPLKQLFNFYFDFITPIIGNLISKDFKAYCYLSKSVKNFPSNKEFKIILKEIGFSECNYYPLTFGAVSLYVAIK